MGRRKKEKVKHEDHPDETWLVPYSDILTLLLALFIVLFASSQIDNKKFEQMAKSFNSVFNGGENILENSKMTPEQPPEQAQIDETIQLLNVKKQLDEYISKNNLSQDLGTQLTGEGLMIRIRDSALFPSGRAELIPESRRLATEIAKMLALLNQKVVVSGHTDNIPINTAEFPSNWDLSSKRALNFMKFILAQDESLQTKRFSATGYADNYPIADNATLDGKAQNRRVEVLIQRNYH